MAFCFFSFCSFGTTLSKTKQETTQRVVAPQADSRTDPHLHRCPKFPQICLKHFGFFPEMPPALKTWKMPNRAKV